MGWSFFLCPILCFQFLFFPFPSSCASLNPMRSLDEASALLQFKNSFTLLRSGSEGCVEFQSSCSKIESWKNHTNYCMWDGVTCDTVYGYVIGLDLSSSWLYGVLHPNNSLFQLTHLRTLNLAHNNFIGSQISSKFGGFVSLTHLNLSFSLFNGEIPHEISHLSRLVSLDLSGNWYHDGSLTFEASTWRSFIQNVTDLRDLNLDDVNMSFIRPDSLSLLANLSSSLVSLSLDATSLQGTFPKNILHLPKLQYLSLSLNRNLSLQIPMSNTSTSLRYLVLSYNDFAKHSLNSIGYLKSLNFLYLVSCGIQGLVPQSFGNLTQLTHLILGRNYFSEEIPSSLSNLQHLTHLDLSSNNFSGQIPSSLSNLQHLIDLDLSSNNFSGQIPSSLSNLQHLTDLDLSSNNFSGQIPSSLSNLQHLTYLDLSFNNFSGQILSSLLNLQHLTYLHLSSNNFSGQIPSSLSNLQHLTFLDLSFNYFSGQIPNVFSPLSQLESLRLSNNNLEGQLPPSLFSLTQVLSISCSYNMLEGQIPEDITGLLNLIDLDIGHNFLNGIIPSWCFSLPSLQQLSLFDNQLTGNIGEFSSYTLQMVDLSGNMLQNNFLQSMSNLTYLIELSLSSNNLSGVLDFSMFSKLNWLEFLDLSKNRFFSLMYETNVSYTFPILPKLESLDLSYNIICGSVPKWLNDIMGNKSSDLDLSQNLFSSIENLLGWNMPFLDLSFNSLEGNLPIPLFGNKFFSVSNNKLTGHISSMICNASTLTILDLSHNKLSGLIPQCLGTLPYLSVIDLQMNNLFGILPRNISRNNMLQTLKYNHNYLEGPLPQSLTHYKQLEVLDLGDNEIEDLFPNWLESLEELQVLVLRANHFHGMIAISKSKNPFPKLRIFDISNNHFKGPLPALYIKQFKGMMNIDDSRIGLQYMRNENMSSYYDSVDIIMKGISMELTKILVTFTTIDLSNNKFEGDIPQVIGELNSLIGLNLSHNRINGTIPSSLGDLKSLEWLDLSSNQLMGEIPTALVNLNYLSFLNFSHNQLSGVIPQGNQFNTFLNDSYEDNEGLCGPPFSKSCDSDQEAPQPSSLEVHSGNEFGFGWKSVVVGYGCGFLFGVLMGYIVFSTRRPQWLVNFARVVPKKRVRSTKRQANPSRGRIN